jgi:hypothetical protein
MTYLATATLRRFSAALRLARARAEEGGHFTEWLRDRHLAGARSTDHAGAA